MEYYILAVFSFVITIIAQVLVSFRYSYYSKIDNKKKYSGLDVAKEILSKYDLDDVYVVETKGYLSDHYDPSAKVIRLSSSVFHGTSIASLAVAAHEVGHAIQYKEGNKFILIRSAIFPFVNICSKLGYVVILLSLFTGIMKMFYLGIAMLFFILIFQILTLPVEFGASRKAMNNLEKFKMLDTDEIVGAKKMLTAAALTYVASLATTVIEILRLILLADNGRK